MPRTHVYWVQAPANIVYHISQNISEDTPETPQSQITTLLSQNRGTKRMRDEEEIRTKQTPHIQPQTAKKNCNRETALERTVGWDDQ